MWKLSIFPLWNFNEASLDQMEDPIKISDNFYSLVSFHSTVIIVFRVTKNVIVLCWSMILSDNKYLQNHYLHRTEMDYSTTFLNICSVTHV